MIGGVSKLVIVNSRGTVSASTPITTSTVEGVKTTKATALSTSAAISIVVVIVNEMGTVAASPTSCVMNSVAVILNRSAFVAASTYSTAAVSVPEGVNVTRAVCVSIETSTSLLLGPKMTVAVLVSMNAPISLADSVNSKLITPESAPVAVVNSVPLGVNNTTLVLESTETSVSPVGCGATMRGTKPVSVISLISSPVGVITRTEVWESVDTVTSLLLGDRAIVVVPVSTVVTPAPYTSVPLTVKLNVEV